MAGFLDTLFGGGAEKEAADKNRAAAAQYGTQSQGYLDSAYGTGTDALGKAVGAYTPLADLGAKYSGGAGTYMGAIGAGTPEAGAAARTAFENTPGLQAMRDAATQAVARQHANAGTPSSGNADIDAILASAGITGQQYQQFVNNLGTAGQMGINATGAAAGGQAAGYGGLAQLAANYGQSQTGVAGNVLSADTSANNLQAQGEASGAKNLLNAGLGVASLAMGMPSGTAGSLLSLGQGVGQGAGNLINSGFTSPFPKGGFTGFTSSPQGY